MLKLRKIIGYGSRNISFIPSQFFNKINPESTIKISKSNLLSAFIALLVHKPTPSWLAGENACKELLALIHYHKKASRTNVKSLLLMALSPPSNRGLPLRLRLLKLQVNWQNRLKYLKGIDRLSF
jgi:hypothetical protein